MIYWALGIFTGLLSGLLGVGGGLFLTPVLVVIFQHQKLFVNHLTQAAIGTSLAVIALTALTSMIAYHHRKNVDWHIVRYLLPGLICGPWIGSLIGTSLPSAILTRLLGITVLILSIQMLLPQQIFPRVYLRKPHLLGVGAITGTFSGLIGIGGGIFLIPLMHACGIPLRRAAGTGIASAFFVAFSSVISLTLMSHLKSPPTHYIFWPAVLQIVPGSMIFAWIGTSISHRLPTNLLKRCFAFFLALMAFYLVLYNHQ